MRAPRANRALTALAALAALLCGPAAGRGEDIFDTIRWQSPRLTVISVKEPTTNLLLVVSDGTTTVIAKFSCDVPLTINFADRLLEGRGIPVPKSLTLSLTDERAKKAKDAIVQKVPDQRLVPMIARSTTLSLFEPVTTPGDVGTVQNVFMPIHQMPSVPGPDGTAIKNAIPTMQFDNLTQGQRTQLNGKLTAMRELVRCLNDPKQRKLLGAIYVLDAFLGNEDRLQKKGNPNWRNLMLGTVGGRRMPTFVAIDNHAFAPSLEQLAWVDNRNAAKDALVHKTPGAEHKIKVTINGRQQWVERLIHGRVELNQYTGMSDENNLFCGDLDLAFQFDRQSKEIVDSLRGKLHNLLFTEMGKLVEPVTLSPNSRLATAFTDFNRANITKAASKPAVTDDSWAFAISSVSAQNKLTYQAFKIDWGQVRADIASEMRRELGILAFMLPRSGGGPDPYSLSLDKFRNSGLMTTRKQAIKLSGPFPDTLAAEALFVRLAYLAIRQPDPTGNDDATARTKILGAFPDANTAVTYDLVYVAPPQGAAVRRKAR
jgi:hypothetical protein